MSYVVATFVGGLVPTFLISRAVMFLGKKVWRGRIADICIAHAISLGLSIVLAAFGYANGGPLNWAVGMMYALPQAVWLVVDLLRHKGGNSPIKPRPDQT